MVLGSVRAISDIHACGLRRAAGNFIPIVAKVAKTFGLSRPTPKLLASFATGHFSSAARLTRPIEGWARVGGADRVQTGVVWSTAGRKRSSRDSFGVLPCGGEVFEDILAVSRVAETWKRPVWSAATRRSLIRESFGGPPSGGAPNGTFLAVRRPEASQTGVVGGDSLRNGDGRAYPVGGYVDPVKFEPVPVLVQCFLFSPCSLCLCVSNS
jgi:hypothetical protein